MAKIVEHSPVIVDAHVHMGYYPRVGQVEPRYYSPRRILGVLSRCGVSDFIVSSTNSQVEGIGLIDIIREAREMHRIAGSLAHQILWVSGRILDLDPQLGMFDAGLYEGIKLHGMETPWITERRDDLFRVLDVVAERKMIVQFHTGFDKCCHPYELGKFAQRYPSIRMDFAHCSPLTETIEVMRSCPNVFTDISFMPPEAVDELLASDVVGRVMFGSDFPAYHAYENRPLTAAYRQKALKHSPRIIAQMAQAFRCFVYGASGSSRDSIRQPRAQVRVGCVSSGGCKMTAVELKSIVDDQLKAANARRKR